MDNSVGQSLLQSQGDLQLASGLTAQLGRKVGDALHDGSDVVDIGFEVELQFHKTLPNEKKQKSRGKSPERRDGGGVVGKDLEQV
jgi:hypothetical protein